MVTSVHGLCPGWTGQDWSKLHVVCVNLAARCNREDSNDGIIDTKASRETALIGFERGERHTALAGPAGSALALLSGCVESRDRSSWALSL